jgi:Zn-dependent M28 family amino/carboxypeptidase
MTMCRSARRLVSIRSIATAALLGATLVLPPAALAADSRPFIQPGASGKLIQPQAPDAELRTILRQIDPNRLEQTVRSLVAFGTRHTLSSQTDPVRGIGAATAFVVNELQTIAAGAGGSMTVQQQAFIQPVSSRIPVPTVITNVIATIRGSASPDRIQVVLAHLDSRVTDVLDFTSDAPGADSDASGVAVVIELARVFAAHQPKSTIVLSTVAGTEQGLYGSAFEAAQFKAAGANIAAMFSVDRVGASIAEDGTSDAHTLRLFTEGVPTSETALQAAIRQAFGSEVDGISRELGRFVLSVAQSAVPDMRIRHIYRRDRVLHASDQVSYLDQGYAAARFAEPHENFAHENQDVQVVNGVQFGDLVDFLDFDYMARVAKVAAATVWSLAQGPAAPKNVRLNATTGGNNTVLTWDANTEADLAGYEVVWRETTDPDWTNVIPVGNVTTVTLPHFSKDNVFFGVRAVDASRHHSPVAFPAPI